MEEGTMSCIAVSDMLKKRLEEYTDALSSGVDRETLTRMEDDIDKIEAVHEKCRTSGVSVDIEEDDPVVREDVSSIVVDELEGEDMVDDSVDSIDDWSERMFDKEEEEGN